MKLIAITVGSILAIPWAVGNGAAHDTRRMPGSDFAIVITAVGPEVQAFCEQGCAWTRVTAKYPRDAYNITEEGIQPVPDSAEAAHTRVSGFGLLVTVSDGSVDATCVHGCAWKSVSARHPAATYRITEHGIEPAHSPVQ